MSRTIRVRIALAVDPTGAWNAVGWGDPKREVTPLEKMDAACDLVGTGEARYWLEAEIQVPEARSVTATVFPSESESHA